MAAKPERIKVEVTDSTAGETRTFKIVLMAPNSAFQLADLLRQRGVISSINSELKQAVKVATQNYLSGADALISTLAKGSTAPPKVGNNRNRKDRIATRVRPATTNPSEVHQDSTAGSN